MKKCAQNMLNDIEEYINELEDRVETLEDEVKCLQDDCDRLCNDHTDALYEVQKLEEQHQKLLDQISEFLGTNLSKEDIRI